MTHTELAKILNGREIEREERELAKRYGLVVAFGYSDDNLELRGAIDDEVSCYNGKDFRIGPDGILEEKNARDEMELREARKYIARERTAKNTIKAEWNDNSGPSWKISIDCQHSTFEIMEDGEVFCVGIVFSVADLAKPKRSELREKAQAVVDRWESPQWKEAEPTASVIYALRDELEKGDK